MKPPSFWYRERPSLAALVLQPFGALYGAIAARRMARPGAHRGVSVITIGNFVAGGAGKTPTAIAIAQLLAAQGERPAFVSRGHGGRVARGGPPMRVAGQTADEVGDEPLLLARIAPTFVGRDRAAAAALAIHDAKPSVLVLDDGLQSRQVEPDIAIAVVDGTTGIGDGLCLPAGPLRAPLTAQMQHVHAVVLVGAGAAGERVAEQAHAAGKPVFRARLAPDDSAQELGGQAVVAFAGIGLPDKFFATVAALGAKIAARRAFPDHYRYSVDDIAGLLDLARAANARLVTTEKDAMRLPAMPDDSAPIVIRVRLAFEDEAAVRAFLAGGLAQARRRARG